MEEKETTKIAGFFAQQKQKSSPDASGDKRFSILWDQIFVTTVVNGDPEKKIPASTGFQ